MILIKYQLVHVDTITILDLYDDFPTKQYITMGRSERISVLFTPKGG